MCWWCDKPILKEVPPRKKVPVYKIITMKKRFLFPNKLISYYKGFEYKLHSLFTSVLEEPNHWGGLGSYSIDKGIHSYIIENGTTRRDSSIIVLNNKTGDQVASYPINTNNRKFTNVKVLGYIPEGSKYYINEDGECVSDKIILTKIIKYE